MSIVQRNQWHDTLLKTQKGARKTLVGVRKAQRSSMACTWVSLTLAVTQRACPPALHLRQIVCVA
jgi:hypothetical protein